MPDKDKKQTKPAKAVDPRKPKMLPGDWTDPVIEAERGISDEYVLQTRLNRRRLLETERRQPY